MIYYKEIEHNTHKVYWIQHFRPFSKFSMYTRRRNGIVFSRSNIRTKIRTIDNVCGIISFFFSFVPSREFDVEWVLLFFTNTKKLCLYQFFSWQSALHEDYFFKNYSVVQRLLNQDGACQLNQDIFAYYIGDYDDNSYSFVEMEETVRAYIIMH